MTTSNEALHEFERLVYEGRLYELIDWIKKGKPVRFVHGRYKKPISGLEIAIDSAFHSMVFEILKRASWTEADLGSALHQCAFQEQQHLCELLLDFGAPVTDVPFEYFCKLMDVDFLDRVVRLGADPTKGDGFAQALFNTSGRPLFRFFKENRSRISGLDEQMNIALIRAIQNRKVRASLLFLWAGADLSKQTPCCFRDDFEGYSDPERSKYDGSWMTTGYKELARLGDKEFFLKLKLDLSQEFIPEMLKQSTFRPEGELVLYLLDKCPAESLNSMERNSCEALEELIRRFYFDHSFQIHSPEKVLETIEAFLQKGARWNPSNDNLKSARRALKTAPQNFVIGVVELLYRYEQNSQKVWALINTPKIKEVMGCEETDLFSRVKDRAVRVKSRLPRSLTKPKR